MKSIYSILLLAIIAILASSLLGVRAEADAIATPEAKAEAAAVFQWLALT